MPTLMVSLDKKILDPATSVAMRMVKYGQHDPLSIVIPASERKTIQLSPNITVHAAGGSNRLAQYLSAFRAAKSIVAENQNDWITTQDPFFTGLLGVWLKQSSKTKLMVQCHGDFFSGTYYRSGSGLNRFRYLVARYYVIPRADRIRVVGERIKQSLLALGVPEDKIVVRPVPLDMSMIRSHVPTIDLRVKYPGYKKILLALGRLDPVKNLNWLIEQMAIVTKQQPSTLLLIVGDGSERTHLEALVNAKQLSHNVKFEPWTNDPMSYVKTCDALLFPSLSEGYGLVVMEAMAVGTPVIMNDVGVAGFEAKATSTLQIVPIANTDAWVKAIFAL